MRYDIAIIGTGPAGLESAITAKVRHKNIILIGPKTLSKKVELGHKFENYLGLSNISGKDLNEAFQQHLQDMNIEITPGKITAIYNMGDYFSLSLDNNFIEASSVIIATGVNFGKSYPGEDELLGRGVSYCATCDGNLYKNKRIIVIGDNEDSEEEANYLSTLTNDITYISTKEVTKLNKNIKYLQEKVVEIKGTNKVEEVVTEKGSYQVDGLFILRDAISPKNLVPGLKVDDKHIIVDRNMKTNIEGLFACGDIVGEPYQCIKAAGEGNIAALSAIKYLDNKKRDN